MKLYLHIGMGKTGTTSIQSALADSKDRLLTQNAHYYGMWFNFLDPKFTGVVGVRDMLRSSPELLVSYAERMIAHMQQMSEKQGIDTFILSNEDISSHIGHVGPFIKTLAEKSDLKLVMYVRDVQSWLPSAYAQWAMRHKTAIGKIPPFREAAPRLVQLYKGIDAWKEQFPDHMMFRKYDKSVDVVADFASVVGFDIAPLMHRALERSEDAELLLRAVFNNRFNGEVFPDRFNRVVFAPGRQTAPAIKQLIADYFDYSGADEVIASELPYFKAVGEKIGVDFSSGGSADVKPVDEVALRNRVSEYLLEIVLDQANRLQQFERRLKDLEEKAAQ